MWFLLLTKVGYEVSTWMDLFYGAITYSIGHLHIKNPKHTLIFCKATKCTHKWCSGLYFKDVLASLPTLDPVNIFLLSNKCPCPPAAGLPVWQCVHSTVCHDVPVSSSSQHCHANRRQCPTLCQSDRGTPRRGCPQGTLDEQLFFTEWIFQFKKKKKT